MSEEQFEALLSLMKDIAYRETGNATHQQRAGDGFEAENYARMLFDLPPKEEDEGQSR